MSPFVFDVSAEEFSSRVIERSHQVPVLVDFWAEWCGPCRMLGPVLEKLASEFSGSFELAKVDTEANQDIARQFRIQSIPAVKLFIDGEVAAEFVGAQPESTIRSFLNEHCPSEADKLFARARELVRSDPGEEAQRMLREVLELESEHSGAHLELARIAFAAGNSQEVQEHLDKIPSLAKEADEAKSLREALQLLETCRRAGGEDSCRKAFQEDPEDLDRVLALGSCLAARGEYREALELFLKCVARDRNYQEGAARKAMLTVFGLAGVRSALSDEYRRKLAIYL